MQLFKYFPETRFEDVLKNEKVRFSQASALNDPWEMKPHVEQFYTEQKLRQVLQQGRAKDSVIAQDEEAFKQFWKSQRKRNPHLGKKPARVQFEQFKKQNPYALSTARFIAEELAIKQSKERDPQFIKKYLEIFEDLGVLSLTEEPNNILMWAHYSNSHKGFVVELDPQHSFFTVLKKHDPVKTVRPILYSKTLPHLDSVEDIFGSDKGLDAMLFTKDERWSYEKEWRLVADRLDAIENKTLPGGEIAWLYHLPASCIKRVILGCSMSASDKAKFTHLIKTDSRYKHTRLQEAVRVAGRYDLQLKDL